MAEITIKVKGYRCERCGHEWIPREKLHLFMHVAQNVNLPIGTGLERKNRSDLYS